MNAPHDPRVEDELLSGAAAVANARNRVVIDSGARRGDGGAMGEPEEGGRLVQVMQQSITPSQSVWVEGISGDLIDVQG
jgi:hypothetical protein